MMPFPFTRGLFVYGEMIDVPADASSEALEEKRAALERALNDLSDYAEKHA